MDPDQAKSRSSRLIETEALVVAYAMSRLDDAFLARYRLRSWRAAFKLAEGRLEVPWTSIKNLRDEFDPVHPNRRKGWHKRPLRQNRQQIIGEFWDTSDAALLELVDRIFAHDAEVEREVTRPLATARRGENVAERLRTGRAAEQFLMAESQQILGLSPRLLIDRRDHAIGYDFERADRPNSVIEVKGLAESAGTISFTDHEWSQAVRRRTKYLVVIIAQVHTDTPRWRLIPNPAAAIEVRAAFRRQATISWNVHIQVA